MGEFTIHPIYRQVEQYSTVLIGVNHTTSARENRQERRKFLETVLACDHLLLESNGFTYKDKKWKNLGFAKNGTKNYEQTAIETDPKKVVFLEKDHDPERTYSPYGIPNGTGILYESILFAGSMISGMGGGRIEIDPLVQFVAELYSLSKVQSRRLHSQWVGVARYIARTNNPHVISSVTPVFEEFSRKVRSYEVIGPTALRLAKELKGKKAVIIGSLHVNTVYDILNGIPTPQPKSWNEIRSKSSASTQEVISDIEKIVSTVQ